MGIVLEKFLAGEVLEIRVIDPAPADTLVGQSVDVLELPINELLIGATLISSSRHCRSIPVCYVTLLSDRPGHSTLPQAERQKFFPSIFLSVDTSSIDSANSFTGGSPAVQVGRRLTDLPGRVASLKCGR